MMTGHTAHPDEAKRAICYFCNKHRTKGKSVFCLQASAIWVCNPCALIILQLTIDEYGNVTVKPKANIEDQVPAPRLREKTQSEQPAPVASGEDREDLNAEDGAGEGVAEGS